MHRDDAIVKELLQDSDSIPQDYGGSGPSLREMHGNKYLLNLTKQNTYINISDMLLEKFQKYQTLFDTLDQLRVDESLRPSPLENDETLGYHGNFKKLNVD